MFFRLALFFLVLPSLCFSQNIPGYQPIASEPDNLAQILSEINAHCETTLSQLSKKANLAFREMYIGRRDFLKTSLSDGHFLFSPTLQAYSQNILAEIVDANPELAKKKIRFLISRYPMPNASSVGEGTVIINIGLLAELENESQLAFILCHEIAHFQLGHAESRVEKKVQLEEAEHTKKELRRISKLEYGAAAEAAELLQGIVYDHRHQSREHELEADSLGLVYLRKTKYDAQEAIRSMEILDSIDAVRLLDSIDLKTMFNSPNYPFKERWLAKRELLTMGGQNENEEEFFNLDSLKTHPDCAERNNCLHRQLKGYFSENKIKDSTADASINFWRKKAAYEIVEGYYFFEEMADCLYQSIYMLQESPGEPYLHAKIGLSFYTIHKGLMEHNLDKQVPLPSPHHHPTYRQLVRFIHNLRSRELAKVGYYYLKDREKLYGENEDFLYALALAAKMMEFDDEFQSHRKKYMATYPMGRFYVELKSL